MNSPAAPQSWIDACRAFAVERGTPAWVVDDLAAFATAHPRGGPPLPPEAPWPGSFEALEAHRPAPLDTAAVTLLLAQEADGAQPAVFARRVAAVERILTGLGSPAARVLRVGLRARLDGIAAERGPRLRRVRALADFYYSLAARLRHPEWVDDERHLEDLVDGLAWTAVAPGLEHAVIDGLAEGMPVHVNVLRIDPALVRIDVEDLTGVTRGGTDFPTAVGVRAVAGISGGFFLYSEDDITPPCRRHDAVGLLVREGEVLSPPTFARAALTVADDGTPDIGIIGLRDVKITIGGRPVVLEDVINRAAGMRGADRPSVAVVGGRVAAVGTLLPVPLNGFVATLRGEEVERVRAGDAVRYELSVRAGIAGGPQIVRDGAPTLDMQAEDFWGSAPPITFSQDETGDRNLLARMAVGLDAQGRLLAAAIDGRNVERALGMTLGDAGKLMIRLGCTTAMNLDGGSSKRMLVSGRVVDLPSTEIVAGESAVVRVRPVHSAVLFAPR